MRCRLLYNLEFAQKAFIVRESRLLLIRKSVSSPVFPGKWEVPGGRIMWEESLAENLSREVYEEVGLQVSGAEPFALWDWMIHNQNGGTRIIAAAMFCRADDGEPTLKHQLIEDNIDCFEWVHVSALRQFEFIPDFAPIVDVFLRKYYT